MFIYTHMSSALVVPDSQPSHLKKASSFISKVRSLTGGQLPIPMKVFNQPTQDTGESYLQGFFNQNCSLCLKMLLAVPSFCPPPQEDGTWAPYLQPCPSQITVLQQSKATASWSSWPCKLSKLTQGGYASTPRLNSAQLILYKMWFMD